MRWIISSILTLILVTSSLYSDAPSVGCQDALDAQDEVIRLLEEENAKLRGALEARKAEAGAMTKQIEALQSLADRYRQMWAAEADMADKAVARQKWMDRFRAVTWSIAGAGAGYFACEVAR